jgi:hypothetical protein
MYEMPRLQVLNNIRHMNYENNIAIINVTYIINANITCTGICIEKQMTG